MFNPMKLINFINFKYKIDFIFLVAFSAYFEL